MDPHSLSRRDLLAAFLGAPAALAGCSGARNVPLPAGQIIGPSEGIGHKLRDGLRVTPERWSQKSVVIVGGGVAGLASAWRLRKAGFTDFTLLELESVAGGTSRSGSTGGLAYPWGAHYLPRPMKENRLLVGLLDEMGVLEGRDADGEPIAAEQYLCRDPHERIFWKGRWYDGLYLHAGASPEDEAQLKKFQAEVDRWVSWRDGKGRRAFTLPVATGSDDAEVTALDKITMADWLDQHGFTSPRLRWLVDYSCRDDYGARSEQVSAWAGLFYFASRQPKPGAEAEPLLTWPEGNGFIVNHLHKQVSAQVQLGWAVADVNPTNAANVDVVAVHGPDLGQSQGIHAEQVIVAAPQYLARYLIRPYREAPPKHLAEFEYGAWLVANLHLKDRPKNRGFPLAWDNVLYDSPSLGYVVATHQRLIDYGPTILTYYYPLCDDNSRDARARLLGLDWPGCADIALTDLGRAHADLRVLTERLDVMRWGHAMIRPRPGFVWGGARTTAALPYRGIHFAGADLGGAALFEEAFYHGVRAAEEVLAARGRLGESLL